MLTVKFMKYGAHSTDRPMATEGICVRTGKSVHVRYEADFRAVVQVGDAPGETFEATVGENRTDCLYSVAYVMNESGRTVETIR